MKSPLWLLILPLGFVWFVLYMLLLELWTNRVHSRLNQTIWAPVENALTTFQFDLVTFLLDDCSEALNLYDITNPLKIFKLWNAPMGIEKWEAKNASK